jgi:hypothetical protein
MSCINSSRTTWRRALIPRQPYSVAVRRAGGFSKKILWAKEECGDSSKPPRESKEISYYINPKRFNNFMETFS